MKRENFRQGKNNSLLFSITKKDLVVEYYAASSGPGGQNVNKVASTVRITHPPSGAIGQSKTHRTQEANKKAALKRLVNSKQFQSWLRMEVAARIQGYSNLEAKIDEQMKDNNLKVEVFTKGQWRK